MKMASWILMSLLLVSSPCPAENPVDAPPNPLKELSDKVTSIEKEADADRTATRQRLNALEKETDEVSNKLGAGFGSDTIERRLTDLERRLARIERDIDQLESRVSKVESKR